MRHDTGHVSSPPLGSSEAGIVPLACKWVEAGLVSIWLLKLEISHIYTCMPMVSCDRRYDIADSKDCLKEHEQTWTHHCPIP